MVQWQADSDDCRPESELETFWTTAYQKGSEWYILIYSVNKKNEALRQIERWAANDDLAFKRMDAEIMSLYVVNNC